jgi:hypothetical protein
MTRKYNPLQTVPMNIDTVEAINNLILECPYGILIGGISCVGKSHFNMFLDKQKGFIGNGACKYPSAKEPHRIQKLGVAELTKAKNVNEYYEICKWKGIRGIILVGTSYKTWQQQAIIRESHNPVCRNRTSGRKSTIEHYTNYYSNTTKKLQEYNLPHLLIDNRDGCTILNREDFLTMIRS